MQGGHATAARGENLHALRRSLAYAGEGALRRRHHEQQTEQMWCLALATSTANSPSATPTATGRYGWPSLPR